MNRFYVQEEIECPACKGTGKCRAGTLDCSDYNNIWPGQTIECSNCKNIGKVTRRVSLEYALREMSRAAGTLIRHEMS